MCLKRKMKKLIILSSLLLSACTTEAPVVACHEFGTTDKAAIRTEILALPDGSALHPVIRDYERVCTALKQ